jgi:ring-1,2-phenylacetyl-CoA epoxidase subunit PaaC
MIPRAELLAELRRELPEAQLLLLADTCLLWGHRLSEWCGHGPALEEDIALTNTALDVIGHARSLYQLHSKRVGGDVTEDTLAYFRDAQSFKNVSLAAVTNGDYAQTTLRSLYLSAWFVPLWESLATGSRDVELRSFAHEAAKASRTQLRHSRDWVIRFGDGTGESRRRIENAIEELGGYVAELFAVDIEDTDREVRNRAWLNVVNATFDQATLPPFQLSLMSPSNSAEDRAVLLNEMQSLAREHPGANW